MWKTLVWMILFALSFVVVVTAGVWLWAAPVGTETVSVVDGVTVARESSTDYTQLIFPILFLAAGLVGMTSAGTALWRALHGSH